MGRLFGFISVVIVLGVGMYIYSKQAQSSSAQAGANNPKAAINITGVRSDLISIATTERRYYATEGKYASLDELISSNYLTIARQRPPYTYRFRPVPVASAPWRPGPGMMLQALRRSFPSTRTWISRHPSSAFGTMVYRSRL